jgi:hypothetical protein
VLIVEIQPAGYKPAQIVFDAGLILRGGRHDPGGGDEAFCVDGVPVEQHPARGFCGAMPGRGARRNVHMARRGLVSLDQPQRLVHRVHHLDGADQDAAVRVAALGTEARLVGGLPRHG